ncbi:MAG: hypothetical protein PHG80_11855, partial [Methanoregulaceae archaeon]|nr:hypothetical protein [Methanoregulaceae archaeon]
MSDNPQERLRQEGVTTPRTTPADDIRWAGLIGVVCVDLCSSDTVPIGILWTGFIFAPPIQAYRHFGDAAAAGGTTVNPQERLRQEGVTTPSLNHP